MRIDNLLEITMQRARCALLAGCAGLIERVGQPVRVARVLSILRQPVAELMVQIASSQHSDGGWSDVEETLWCLRALRIASSESENRYEVGEPASPYSLEITKGIRWLKKMRHRDGGWGLSDRDNSRIPTTALILTLLPDLADECALTWLSKQWKKDLKSTIRLTYKGGFTLMALARHRNTMPEHTKDIVWQTVDYLKSEQNEDGGFGPWKGHPIGSDPWSTGINLVGLCSWQARHSHKSIARAVQYLCSAQLENGLWPYHFIDEGSIYAYWGLDSAYDYLCNQEVVLGTVD